MAASILTPEDRAEVDEIRGEHVAEESICDMMDDGWFQAHGHRGALLRIIDRLSASPWRPVTETEPARGERWLVMLGDGADGPQIMWRLEPSETRCDRWAWDYSERLETFCVPSHWMPLPPCPDKEKP